MGIFGRKSRQNTSSSLILPHAQSSLRLDSSSVACSSTPSSPYTTSVSCIFHGHHGHHGKSGKSTPSSLSPNLNGHAHGSPSTGLNHNQPTPIRLRVAIDPIPFHSNNEHAKNLFYVQVCPEEGIAALRREIARTVGHGSMSLFKVSIPQQAFLQSRSYTERYGKPVHLLSQFPAFNLDDSNQLELSLGPNHTHPTSENESGIVGNLKIKHWFPDFVNGYNPSDMISIVARPLLGLPVNHTPLTLRAYFAQPPNTSTSSASGSSSCLRSLPPPIVVDIDPHTTVDELKSELLRSAGKDDTLYKQVTLWQIEMTEKEMNVIDELGRLKNGKMPWPYPPGAMEPIPMTDGNLPVSLFFPKSAPNGDMLNLSIWLNSTSISSNDSNIPHFRYPMTNLTRPASTHCASPTISTRSIPSTVVSTPITELPPSVQSALSSATLRVKKSRVRPSTAPAATASASAKSFGSSSTKPPPPGSIRSTSTSTSKSITTDKPKGLGIVTLTPSADTPILDRTSFSSTLSTESDMSVPSLINHSQLSLETLTITNVKTPLDDNKSDWLSPTSSHGQGLGPAQAHVQQNDTLLKQSMLVNKGSLRDRLRKVL
ncbi:hypothetical protein I204_00568 [Kwoniella mangroviensis CBS 8886]|uniref:uncharacterized protein n=1 Tax=Kwoniella mangroviensis CBS 8507 TaxID=1296122 RepID=UPI00080D3F02|nr:uncharacterized protein I203_07184 [Kwoniella mangroviensis CBS 8507]OCF63863.1 hypothetical protein I203_07184 [Kwoniella mangroviensis CBS 8507]OCF78626.1 hypothetical protein I204_00568 [Kwoniella mangroviensis CBS 8886]